MCLLHCSLARVSILLLLRFLLVDPLRRICRILRPGCQHKSCSTGSLPGEFCLVRCEIHSIRQRVAWQPGPRHNRDGVGCSPSSEVDLGHPVSASEGVRCVAHCLNGLDMPIPLGTGGSLGTVARQTFLDRAESRGTSRQLVGDPHR